MFKKEDLDRLILKIKTLKLFIISTKNLINKYIVSKTFLGKKNIENC